MARPRWSLPPCRGWHLACMPQGMVSERSIDVLVIGGASFDYEIRAPELPRPGDTVVGDEPG